MTDAPLKVAQLHALDQGIEQLTYRQITAEQLATEESGQYDVVTCMEMLEHVPDPASVIAAVHALLKPGGWAFFSTINRNPKSWLFAVVGAEYVLKLLPKGTHEFKKFIRPGELSKWARQAGLKTTDFRGLRYNPLNNSFKLTDDVSVNYLMASRKPE